MARLDTLKNAHHDTVKSWVLRALRRQPSGRCSQHTLVHKICSMHGVSSLRGRPREDFVAKVNKAVSALLREKPPRIERVPGGSSHIRLAG